VVSLKLFNNNIIIIYLHLVCRPQTAQWIIWLACAITHAVCSKVSAIPEHYAWPQKFLPRPLTTYSYIYILTYTVVIVYTHTHTHIRVTEWQENTAIHVRSHIVAALYYRTIVTHTHTPTPPQRHSTHIVRPGHVSYNNDMMIHDIIR